MNSLNEEADYSPLRAVADLAYCRGGEGLLAVASLEPIGLWDPGTGRWRGVLAGKGSAVLSVDWGMEGTRLVSGSEDGRVRIWDVGTGSLLKTIDAAKRPVKARWQPGGELVASYSSHGGAVRVWNAVSGEQVCKRDSGAGRVDALAYRGDGKVAATAEGKRIVIWDAGTGEVCGELAGHTDWVSAVAWSSDGRRLASLGGDRSIRVWDVDGGTLERVYAEAAHWGDSVVWHPDGRRLATSFLRSIRIWSVDEPKWIGALPGHDQDMKTLDWSADGQTLASGGRDRVICLWDVEAGLLKKGIRTQPVTNASSGGRAESVTEEEFDRLMREWGAVQDQDMSEQAHYDMVRGDLREGVWLWRRADGTVAGRQEKYSWRGEFKFVYSVVVTGDKD